MPLANKPLPIAQLQSFINPAPSPVPDTSNGPGSIAPLPVQSSPTSEDAHVWLNPRTPHSIGTKLCSLEHKAPLLYPGLAAMWNALEEQRAAVLRHYLEVSVAPEGVCVAEATNRCGKTYARAQCGRPVFAGKKTMGLGRAGSPEHRAYEQRIAKREALAELGRLEDAARAMVQAACEFTENLERELEEMVTANFNPAKLAASLAIASEPAPAKVEEPKYKGWLGTLDEETLERTLRAMRDCRAASDGYLERHRAMRPKYGEIAIGSSDVDLLIQGEGIATFLGELSKGHTPREAMDKALEMAQLIVSKHNKTGIKGRVFAANSAELERWDGSGASFLDGVLFTFMDKVKNGRTAEQLATEEAATVAMEDEPEPEQAEKVAEPETVPATPIAIANNQPALVPDVINAWVEAAYADGLPVIEGRPLHEQRILELMHAKYHYSKNDNSASYSLTDLRASYEKYSGTKITPKPLKKAIDALVASGELEVAYKSGCHPSNYKWLLTAKYAKDKQAADEAMRPATHAGLNIALCGDHPALYRFANTLEGVKAAIAHAKSARFAKEYCTILSDEEAAGYRPFMAKYQPKHERYKRPVTKGRGMPKPPKVAELKDTDQVKFNERWSALGAVAMVRPQDGLWQVEVPGYAPMHGADLSLLDLCVQSIAEQTKIQQAKEFNTKWEKVGAVVAPRADGFWEMTMPGCPKMVRASLEELDQELSADYI
jgi:hypothetical protein